jgi:hypothetical protein
MFESRRPSSLEPVTKRHKSPNPCELSGMLATLCSYEDRFGAYHPQTLILMAQLGIAYWRAGQFNHARPLLERAIWDLAHNVGWDCDARLQALAALRNLYSADCDFERAEAIQQELCACQRGTKTDEEDANCEDSRRGKFIFHA